jgi:type VI secretion system protein ImpE
MATCIVLQGANRKLLGRYRISEVQLRHSKKGHSSMTAKELLQAGQLSDARAQLTDRIKSVPADASARVLLFQVLAYQGEWDKAQRHLEFLIIQTPGNATGLLACQNLIAAEKSRDEVASGRQTPDFMTEPPAFYPQLIDAARELRDAHQSQASALLGQIVEVVPELSGEADGVPFTGFSECDATLAGMLEVFVHDRYLWFPFQALRELSIPKPKSFLDLLWTPARIVTWDGLTLDCFLPALYHGSSRDENVQVKLGRMTEWVDLGGGHARGLGQHLLQVGTEEKGILELREVTFFPPASKVSTC